MLPNFFVIGAAKAGTTSLHAYLGEHPDIHMSTVKEPNHFAPEDHSPTGGRHSRIVSDRAAYEVLFESDAPLRGESSPAYSQFPRRPGVPERIHADIPGARFIYLVRDPIDRMVSFYLQRASLGRYGPFTEAIGDIEDPANDYICPSRYMTQVRRYVDLFDSDRLLVVDQADLLGDRATTLREIFAFLGADPAHWSEEFQREQNIGGEKRRYTQRYARLSRSSLVRRALEILPGGAQDSIKRHSRRALKKPLEIPAVEPETRQRLTELLQPEVDDLRRFSGRDFATWSL